MSESGAPQQTIVLAVTSRPTSATGYDLLLSKIRFVIVSSCDMRETWLAFTSIVFAPMRFAMKRWG